MRFFVFFFQDCEEWFGSTFPSAISATTFYQLYTFLVNMPHTPSDKKSQAISVGVNGRGISAEFSRISRPPDRGDLLCFNL